MNQIDALKVMGKIAEKYGRPVFTDDAGYSVRFHHAKTMFKVSQSSVLICGKENKALFKLSLIKNMEFKTHNRRKCSLTVKTDAMTVKITISRWRVWA